jgi:hypothetical protein
MTVLESVYPHEVDEEPQYADDEQSLMFDLRGLQNPLDGLAEDEERDEEEEEAVDEASNHLRSHVTET